MDDHFHQAVHHAVDIGAVATLLGVIFGYLPAVTTILVFVVALIRFFETATVRHGLKRLKTWLSG